MPNLRGVGEKSKSDPRSSILGQVMANRNRHTDQKIEAVAEEAVNFLRTREDFET
jgi:hypothetical protein